MVDRLFLNPCCAGLKNLFSFSSCSICFFATLSHTLTRFEHKLIGLTLLGKFAFDFFGMGTTMIFFRHSGMIPELNDSLPMPVIYLMITDLVLMIKSLLIPLASTDFVGDISLIASLTNFSSILFGAWWGKETLSCQSSVDSPIQSNCRETRAIP